MAQHPAQRHDSGPLPYDLSGVSLLYVEDEGDARDMVSRMLVMNYPKLHLEVANNGAAGLELYRKRLPDIVLTDINMPVMDGIRMSREIRALNPEALIIAVTAHSDTSYLLNAIQIGINHYVLKPINYDELFGALDTVLEQLMLKRLVGEQNRRIGESERLLAAAQRIAHLGSWQWDLDAGTMSWSDELFRICGLEPEAGPRPYAEFQQLLHPEDRQELGKKLRQAVRERRPMGPQICRVVRPDGSLRTLQVEAEVVPDGRGEPQWVIGTSLDVTELKRAEAEIRQLTGELERRVIQRTSLLQASLKELESFSYLVSHDLRAPVARLEGFCRALLEDCADCHNAGCRSYAERAERAVRQVKGIIDAFNQLSHYARCSLAIGEVDLSALAREIASAFRATEPDRRVEFAIAHRLKVQGDAGLLKTALEHLIGNAWKFTAKRDLAQIEFGSREQEGDRVYFVRDNGAGFNMKYLDKLFKPFQTIHSPGEYTWNGTAIGLATVHNIVLRHGGRIWAEGEVDKGATFYFTLAQQPEPGSFLNGN
jgi:PAS domain S-box-containing protein